MINMVTLMPNRKLYCIFIGISRASKAYGVYFSGLNDEPTGSVANIIQLYRLMDTEGRTRN